MEVPVTNDLEAMLAAAAQEQQPGVMVDFTHPKSVYDNIRSAIAYGIRPVVGTTGLSAQQIDELAEFADKASMGCLLIPNFSIGMVLLQQAAIAASQYFDHVEIIELHHNQKADAPVARHCKQPRCSRSLVSRTIHHWFKSQNTYLVPGVASLATAFASIAFGYQD